MLRRVAVVLVVANLAVLAWGRGALAPWWPAPGEGDREPERLQRQQRPDAVRVLSTGARSAAAPASADRGGLLASADRACLQSRALTGAEATALRASLAGVAPDLREVALGPRGGVWTLYMGPYASDEQLNLKREQLRRIRLEAEVLRQGPEAGTALVIGRYDERDQAEAALAQLSQRGLRTARVVALRPPQPAWQWRVEAADAALRERLAAVAQADFQPCPGGAGTLAAPAGGEAAPATTTTAAR
ncbi:hypothetical protein [Aquabacterium sp. J223]|uniref:hypothetical protein n=1 Tax=Aquabacterium sp. J223 TaxID=2898431 RepID=UPI0021AE096B|nr:hypothetical protein [Aquabacterium sp. J223]UUX95914.1 hypothetical protein LRS07_00750 [Aquabacterium sp. J223]